MKLGDIHQGDNNVTPYFKTLEGLWQDLDLFNNYEWRDPDDCNHSKKMVENELIFKP